MAKKKPCSEINHKNQDVESYVSDECLISDEEVNELLRLETTFEFDRKPTKQRTGLLGPTDGLKEIEFKRQPAHHVA